MHVKDIIICFTKQRQRKTSILPLRNSPKSRILVHSEVLVNDGEWEIPDMLLAVMVMSGLLMDVHFSTAYV